MKHDAGQVKINQKAVRSVRRYWQDRPNKLEAGGVLLGRFIAGTSDLVIDEVTTPMRWDKRERHSFHRSQRGHQAYIEEAWEKSDGTCTYLGEWHTHPEPAPTPSGKDLADWRRKLREDVYQGSGLLFLICGITEIRLWQGFRADRKIYQLVSSAR